MAVSLSAQHIVKHYGAVVALSDANLEVHSGEVTALIGANGSGKSTLSKIINGVVALDGGQLLLDGQPVHFASPQAAKKLGISTVFQELSLVPLLTVAENIWLAREPLRAGGLIDQKTERQKTEALLGLFEGTYRSALDAETQVIDLPADEKQIIEILKAISFDPRMIILDEATASLDSRQVERLFELVRQWKQQDKAIVFITHRMEEIFRIADHYSVLRNGVTVGQGQIKEVNARKLVDMMVGKATAENVAKRERKAAGSSGAQAQPAGSSGATAVGRVELDVRGLHAGIVRGVSFQLHAGELLGLGGLKGQGQRELLLALFGDLPYTGEVLLNGAPVHFKHPNQAMKQGVALVPGERAKEGLLPIRSILENLLLPSWAKYGFPTRMRQAREDAERVSNELNLKMAGLDEPVSSLSGGNAQKTVIGKWLLRNPRLLLLDDPTKGVDVNTKAEFYRLLVDLCDKGLGVLFYSSDDEELIGLCDRVLVLQDGVIRSELAGESLNKSNLIAASLGATEASLGASDETVP